ncbi:MAG: 50S ribosomal protein L10 [Sphaerochaetaceae bacterium]|jgi:large subunit ribosomal protein L10|nr:50S ribosomal protein L10 [Sphaerochaetaceae bacterium]NLO59776.1 50S ribosomal protein L10 [Spirochaetales bacterium]MDD2405578.1 50S ribosomal protein L10 [Sphaerochaetaceae bacterium]MDD3669823.1 50S ribosomal protein L10 [Sphaerochaetaceae bacterium]MDD4258853.1 50S ribosomal protein L10 [Sphaerochaetaceae bacterium]
MAEFQARKAQQKVEAVKEITSEFSEYDGFIFTDYRGMTVGQITELRNQLRQNASAYRVVKNRFAKIALNDLDHKGADDILVGPTAVAMTKGEDASNAVSKILFDFTKNAPLQVKGAYLNGKLFSDKEIEAYSKLPTRLDLIAMLMGTMKEPLAKLARTLQSLVDSKQN